MADVARRTFLPHPITRDWIERVREELGNRGRGAQERLREYIESNGVACSSGKLTDILSYDDKGKVEYKTSEIVELVHEHFGWRPPLPPTASIDAGEIAHLGARMTAEERVLIERAARAVTGKSADEAKQILETLLAGLEAKNK